jgi:hypothetical protein
LNVIPAVAGQAEFRSSGIFDFRRVNTIVGRKIFTPDVVFRIFVSATKEIQYRQLNQVMSN